MSRSSAVTVASRYLAERETAVQTARAAGELLLELQTQVRQINFKGQADLVTDADRASEALVAARLAGAFPGDGLLGEETGYNVASQQTDRLWVVDPLDGTTNYAHGFPIYAVSIALVIDGTVEVGAVYVPSLDEMFAAEREQGAWLNGRPLAVTDCDDVGNALLCSGFPYAVEDRPQAFEHWRTFTLAARAVRRIGSAAYDLCCVACGRFDGYWERGPSAWDLAAGSLIVSEAGGLVTSFDGGAFDPFGHEVLAACPGVHAQMSSMLMA